MKKLSIIPASLVSLFFICLGNLEQVKALSSTEKKFLVQIQSKETYQAFRSFIKKAVSNANYRVSYQIESPDKTNVKVQQWFKGNKFRIDTEVEGKNTRIYQIGKETTTCMNQGGNWKCFQLPQIQKKFSAGTQVKEKLENTEKNLESYRNRITKIDSRVIAGEKTSCFRINEPEKNNYWVSCYSKNHGIPLYMKGENSEGTWKMTATDFQVSVSNKNFKLPAEPQSIPNMPGGG